MLFNSLDFAIFLPIVFIIYWSINFYKKLSHQNLIVLIASYLFYGWWEWKFLSLIIISTLTDYFIGLKMSNENHKTKRKALLITSICVNLGILIFFKYCNFFIENFNTAFSFFGQKFNVNTLNIILPVGISFYTFQTLSYTIDIYRKKLTPTKNIIEFSAFVSFFPQLVAGPIERASKLLPQFKKHKSFSFEKAKFGLLEIFWGLFKKIVIADNLAKFVDIVYSDVETFSGFPLIWASIFFAFQIYCDFSGYSSIAIGTAKLFGFDLMTNFKRPYLSANFKEFWNRWHISLSSWFRDYVYIPLGGNRKKSVRNKFNVLLTFVISGFWHGANWTFILWGAVHGLLINLGRLNTQIKTNKIISIFFVFVISVFTWIFFRAENLSDLIYIYTNIFDVDLDNAIGVSIIKKNDFIFFLILIIVLMTIEISLEKIEKNSHIKTKILSNNNYVTAINTLLIFCIYTFGKFENQEFIYFQF